MMFGKAKKEITMKIEGMHCGHCAANLKRALEETDGVKKAEVSFEQASASISYDEAKLDEKKLATVVEETGYHAVLS